MLSKKSDLERLGEYLALAIEDPGDVAALPEADEETLAALSGDPRLEPLLTQAETGRDPVVLARQFIDEYELTDLPAKAEKAAKDGTLALDPISISVFTAVWLLLQTEVKFEVIPNPDLPGKYRWHFELRKKATPAPSLLNLVKYLIDNFGS